MEGVKVNATKIQIEEFKSSILWNDISNELNRWKEGFNLEMLSIVDSAADDNPSTASVLLHMGDLNGRQKAVDYFLELLNVFLSILEDKKNEPKSAD
jgi:predicted TIM-barrel fold metal-dependent hydrolase